MVENPYAMGGIPEHPRIRAQLKAAIKGDEGVYAGMLKFRRRVHNTQDTTQPAEGAYLHRQSLSRTYPTNNSQGVSFLPPNFGRNLNLDVDDSKLMKFCKFVLCLGFSNY